MKDNAVNSIEDYPVSEESLKGLTGFKEKKATKNFMTGTEEKICTDGYIRHRNHPQMKNFHPTTKPIQLGSYLVILGSREDDIVLDPFCGSGSTAVACKKYNRKFIGFEIDKNYYNISLKRLLNVPKRLDNFGT